VTNSPKQTEGTKREGAFKGGLSLWGFQGMVKGRGEPKRDTRQAERMKSIFVRHEKERRRYGRGGKRYKILEVAKNLQRVGGRERKQEWGTTKLAGPSAKHVDLI